MASEKKEQLFSLFDLKSFVNLFHYTLNVAVFFLVLCICSFLLCLFHIVLCCISRVSQERELRLKSIQIDFCVSMWVEEKQRHTAPRITTPTTATTIICNTMNGEHLFFVFFTMCMRIRDWQNRTPSRWKVHTQNAHSHTYVAICYHRFWQIQVKVMLSTRMSPDGAFLFELNQILH